MYQSLSHVSLNPIYHFQVINSQVLSRDGLFYAHGNNKRLIKLILLYLKLSIQRMNVPLIFYRIIHRQYINLLQYKKTFHLNRTHKL